MALEPIKNGKAITIGRGEKYLTPQESLGVLARLGFINHYFLKLLRLKIF
jgi:hypothetical protein